MAIRTAVFSDRVDTDVLTVSDARSERKCFSNGAKMWAGDVKTLSESVVIRLAFATPFALLTRPQFFQSNWMGWGSCQGDLCFRRAFAALSRISRQSFWLWVMESDNNGLARLVSKPLTKLSRSFCGWDSDKFYRRAFAELC